MNETEPTAVPDMAADKTIRPSGGARDVALRELDMAGFRIVNLGPPEEEGAFTSVDLKSVPKAPSGAGAPGKSLLAAPADHVHPAQGEAATLVRETDDSYQTVRGTEEQLVAEFLLEVHNLPSDEFQLTVIALVKAENGVATYGIRYGGTPGKVDGKKVGTFQSNRGEWEVKGAYSEVVLTPSLPELVKITAAHEKREGIAHIRFKKVSASPAPVK
jgi:hypothetical protein